MKTITGKFQVKATPLEADEASKRIGAMRMMFEKTFEGSLAAQSTVSMLDLMKQEATCPSTVSRRQTEQFESLNLKFGSKERRLQKRMLKTRAIFSCDSFVSYD